MPDDPLAALLLARGQLIATPGKGILAAPELHPQRGADQLQCLPEEILEIPRIAGRYPLGLTAVNDEQRRIAPALVNIAPPSLAIIPRMVPKYSRGLGTRNPRWVRRRW